MRAVVARDFGPPNVMEVRDLPDLTPGAHQVLVDAEFSDIGTLDRLVRSGWGRKYFDVDPPYVPGDGVGGVVRAVGAEVDSSWVDRRAVGGTGPRGADGLSAAPIGGYADSALVDVRALVAVPDELPLGTATALLNDGPTSQLLLATTEPRSGDTVLVLAAAGAAGTLLVQLAAAAGATVIAASRGEAKSDVLRQLGVRHVVEYGQDGWTDRVREIAPTGPTVVLDGAGAALGRDGIALVADGGRVVSYGTSAGKFAQPDLDALARRGVDFKGLFDLPAMTPDMRRSMLEKAFAAAVADEARPLLTRVALSDAAQAHAALEARTAVGKTVLTT